MRNTSSQKGASHNERANGFKVMQELIKLKKESPKEYQAFLDGLEGVMRDIMNITTKLAIELTKDMEAKFP